MAAAVDQPINYELSVETIHVSQISSFLQTHPQLATMKFWHGQTLLHKICLRPDANVQLLSCCVDAGSDINEANNFGETAIMFAAKIGSSKMCQYLIDKGADINIKDKAGRGVMHHAVMGGSVFLVHYLHVVHDYNLDAADDRHQTALHISASQGNLHMVKYLLRSGQCDAKKSDTFGNIALHHAAIYGHEPILNAMLTQVGYSLLDSVNNKGETALSVCSGKGAKHRASFDLLQLVTKERAQGKKHLSQPTGLWLWYLFMPSIFFIGGGLLSELIQVLFGWYSGVIAMSLTMLYILYLFMVHSHRIKHPSKMPNPMHAGAFAGGLIGTMIAWILAILPKLDLGHFDNLFVIILVLALAPYTFYSYWKLLTADPGFIPLPNKESQSQGKMKLQLQIEDSASRFCSYCDIIASGNVKHCKLCKRCVVHMDHHCLFLLKCVATNNHRLFVMFIIAVNVDILVFLFSSVQYFYITYSDVSDKSIMTIMATDHIFILFVIVLDFVSIFWGLSLVQWQLRLISLGYTYYESISVNSMSGVNGSQSSVSGVSGTQSNPLTTKARLLNIARFFQGNKTPYKRSTEAV